MNKKAKLKKNKNNYLRNLNYNQAIFFILFLIIIYIFNIVKSNINYFKSKIKPHIAKGTIASVNQPLSSIRLPIFLYHYVEYVADQNDTIRKSLNIQPWVLEKQIQTLKDAGYNFITPSEAIQMLNGSIPLVIKPIILSFDDGYRDFYTDVFPIIKKEKVRAIVYIVPGFIDKINFMFRNQLEEVADSSLIEIGAHTVNHVWLKGLEAHHIKKEIVESKLLLEDSIHRKVVSFAYPYGAFDDQISKIVKEAGFTSSVSTISGIEATHLNKFYLFRLRPGNRIGKSLIDWLDQSVFYSW